MPQPLRLELIEQDRSTELAVLDRAPIDIGREPGESGVTVNASAVSRIHGRFMQFGAHWLFSDTGSTNGSWLNGTKLAPEQPRVIRSGDLLQLGDVGIQVASAGRGERPQASIIAVHSAAMESFSPPWVGSLSATSCDPAIPDPYWIRISLKRTASTLEG